MFIKVKFDFDNTRGFPSIERTNYKGIFPAVGVIGILHLEENTKLFGPYFPN